MMTPELRQHWHILATCSIRRLLRLRHDPRHGADARRDIRRWVSMLRDLEN